MIREKLTLTKDQALDIISDDDENFEVVSDEITGKRRWADEHEVIIKRLSDGKFFKDCYSTGSTENCYERPWEYDDPTFSEVFAVEKTIVVYGDWQIPFKGCMTGENQGKWWESYANACESIEDVDNTCVELVSLSYFTDFGKPFC